MWDTLKNIFTKSKLILWGKIVLSVAGAFTYLLIFTGCFPCSTFQTPVVLPEDEAVFGVGFTANRELFPIPGFELYIRNGFINNPVEKHVADAGFKMSGFPGLYGMFYLDLKYQLIKKPVALSAVLGASVLNEKLDEVPEDVYSSFDEGTEIGRLYWHLHPMLFIGNEHIYGGAKLIVPPSLSEFPAKMVPAVFIGLLLGNRKWYIVPEISAYRYRGELSILPGLGFQIDAKIWESFMEKRKERKN